MAANSSFSASRRRSSSTSFSLNARESLLASVKVCLTFSGTLRILSKRSLISSMTSPFSLDSRRGRAPSSLSCSFRKTSNERTKDSTASTMRRELVTSALNCTCRLSCSSTPCSRNSFKRNSVSRFLFWYSVSIASRFLSLSRLPRTSKTRCR